MPAIEKLTANFRDSQHSRAVRIRPRATNDKVAKLARLAGEAKYEVGGDQR